jgi:valyl-tRNA synthetase
MSKSRGNVIDPIPILEKSGADTFRFWNAAEVSIGSDFRCSEERIAGTGKFLTKLWNLSRFISSFSQPKRAHISGSDRWILSELDRLIERCLEGYDDFNFFIPSNALRDFIWNLFAPHYVEMVKARAYNSDHSFTQDDQKAAWFTLRWCLRTVLILLAPICPHMTDYLWTSIYSSRSIHREIFPRVGRRRMKELEPVTNSLMEFNSAVWKFKKEKGMSLNQPLSRVYTSLRLKSMGNDLKAMHRIEDLRFGTPKDYERILSKGEGTYIVS